MATARKKKAPTRTKKRPAKPKVDPHTQALARLEKKLNDWPGDTLAPGAASEATALSEFPILGDLGTVDIKLRPEEERVLGRPVDPGRVLMKPTGQPYLSHPEYTRWFNEAFGRLGWSIVPVALPKFDGKCILVPYILKIHGKPAAFAYGEQDYHEGNREQTYGDAVEATVASALRRCAKRLGVGLELWDKLWIDQFIHEHCIRVQVWKKKRDGGGKYAASAWRTKDGPRFPDEIDEKGKRTDEGEDVPEEAFSEAPAPAQRRGRGYASTRDGDVISEAQVRRFHVILRNSGRLEEPVRAWLKARFGLDSTKAILRRDYDFICTAIEASGSLPLAGGK